MSLPKTTTTYYFIQAASDIMLLQKNPTTLLLPQQNDPDLNDALKATAELLQQATAKPKHTQIASKQNKNVKYHTHNTSTRF